MSNPRKHFKDSTFKVLVAQEQVVRWSSSRHRQYNTAKCVTPEEKLWEMDANAQGYTMSVHLPGVCSVLPNTDIDSWCGAAQDALS